MGVRMDDNGNWSAGCAVPLFLVLIALVLFGGWSINRGAEEWGRAQADSSAAAVTIAGINSQRDQNIAVTNANRDITIATKNAERDVQIATLDLAGAGLRQGGDLIRLALGLGGLFIFVFATLMSVYPFIMQRATRDRGGYGC